MTPGSAWVKSALAAVQIQLPRTSPLSESQEKVPRREEGLGSQTCGPGVGSGQAGVQRPSPGLNSVRSWVTPVAFEAFLPLPSPSLSRPPGTLSVCSTQPGPGERWCWPPEPALGLGVWPIGAELHGVPGSRGLSSPIGPALSTCSPCTPSPLAVSLQAGLGSRFSGPPRPGTQEAVDMVVQTGFLSAARKGFSFLDRAVPRLPDLVWKLQAQKTL